MADISSPLSSVDDALELQDNQKSPTGSPGHQINSDSVSKDKTLNEVDESLRTKYIEIVQSLTFEELKRFNKVRYKNLVKSDIMEILPETETKDAENTAHYISNALNNEAQRQKGIKRKLKTTTNSRQKQTTKNKGRNVANQNKETENTESSEMASKTTSSASETTLSESVLREMDIPMEEHGSTSNENELSDTFLQDMDSTLQDPNFTINSTVTMSQIDDTYETNNLSDDSVTELKTAVQSNQKRKKKKKTKSNKQSTQEVNQTTQNVEECEITCIENCSNENDTESIRCNLCMSWFHTDCVCITDIDSVGAWVCAKCRKLPETVKIMKTHIETLLDSTMSIFEKLNSFSEKIDNQFGQLNDRITVLANQQKCSNQTGTSSLADIRQDIESFRTDMDKKTNAILSKSQSLYDRVKLTPDLARNSLETPNNQIKSIQEKAIQTSTENKQGTNTNQTVQNKLPPNLNSERVTANIKSKVNSQPQVQNVQSKTEPEKPKLTFITGSCILKGIETKFLDETVRVKSFKNAKIEDLHGALTKMDLSRYKTLVLHIGGQDIDTKISPNSFKEKFKSLLDFLTQKDCKIIVSGLLPRGGVNIKPFNAIIQDLCQPLNISFIDNHGSFIMASGELPFDFFHADKVNLKFAGTRKLVHNINNHCHILPRKSDDVSSVNNVRSFGRNTRFPAQYFPRGSRRSPIFIA